MDHNRIPLLVSLMGMQWEKITIVPFNQEVVRSEFRSGKLDLDTWLHKYAGQNEARNRTRTFFALGSESGSLLGYYSTVFVQLEAGVEMTGLPISKYPKPALLIARLAVHTEAQGRGIGKFMLSDALNRAIVASESAGLEVVMVEAIDADAAAFYGSFGFTRFDAQSLKMFMTMNFLKASQQP